MFNRFTIPLVKKLYPASLTNVLTTVQPMMEHGPGPAAPDVIGAVVLWFQEQFPDLNLEQDRPHIYQIISRMMVRVAILEVLDGVIKFYHDSFDMADPECFSKLSASVVGYFGANTGDTSGQYKGVGSRLPL